MSTNGDQQKEAAAKKKKDEILVRLQEERIPEAVWPTDFVEKKKRPREVAFMDVNLCFPCGKCPEFCPVGCIDTSPDSPTYYIDTLRCIDCTACRHVCPVGAIVSSDFPTAQGAIMILAIAFLSINLLVDVLYVYLDPRVRRR